jgi:hypothetical protein
MVNCPTKTSAWHVHRIKSGAVRRPPIFAAGEHRSMASIGGADVTGTGKLFHENKEREQCNLAVLQKLVLRVASWR